MSELIKFLDWMDATRGMRTAEKSEMIDGYRKEWNRYVDDWINDGESMR